MHRIEPPAAWDSLPGSTGVVSPSSQELEIGLDAMLAPYETIAMQYSPRNADHVRLDARDAGTMEVLREMGKTVVSSADLVEPLRGCPGRTHRLPATTRARRKALDEILAEGFHARLDAGFVPLLAHRRE